MNLGPRNLGPITFWCFDIVYIILCYKINNKMLTNKCFIDEKKAQLTEKNSVGCALTLFKYINPFIVVFPLYVFLNIIFTKNINYFIKTFGKIQSF